MHNQKQGGHRGGLPALFGCLAAATAAAAVTRGVGGGVAAAVTFVDQQQNDDDEQNPVAIIATEQIAQTHVIHPLRLGVRGSRDHLSLTLYVPMGEW